MSKKVVFRLATYGVFSFFMIGYFIYIALTGTYNFVGLKKETNYLEDELNKLRLEEKKLKNEIIKLNDPEYIASYARQHYQYSKEGELIIRINEVVEEDIKEEEKTPYALFLAFATIVIIIFLRVLRKKEKP